MSSIRLNVRQGSPRNVRTDLLVQFVMEDRDLFKHQIRELENRFGGAVKPLKSGPFTGKALETMLLFPEGTRAGRLLIIGLGKAAKLSLEQLRRAGAVVAKEAHTLKVRSVGMILPDVGLIQESNPSFDGEHVPAVASAFAEGALLGSYRFSKYQTRDNPPSPLREILFVAEKSVSAKEIRKHLTSARTVCESVSFARDLANAPANEIYPETLARRAAAAGRASGFRVRILSEPEIRKLRMGGLIGVSRGSSRPPRFIIMEHRPAGRRSPTVVLVGKGVTFDAGGISIKPSAGMAEMKMDMSGAAAVIAAMQAVARLRLPLHVVGLVPATENLLGGSAMKPGDILTHYNGMTSEVDNTDAEGRLILADALAYASRYKPDLVIDLATLTGACVVALGHVATGMMGNDQDMMNRVKAAGERTYERVWQLPLFEEYEKLIKSDIADVKNVGGRWAGAITAALFLKKFTGTYPWIHLDIAGTAMLEEAQHYLPKGGSGVGVRLLVDFLKHWNTP